MEEIKSKVYALIDERSRVLQIDGGYTIQNVDIDTWTFIDEGYGDKYNLCQNNYLDKPVREYRGIPQYKYVDGAIVERTQKEIDDDYEPPTPVPDPQAETDEMLLDHEERIILLEAGE